MSFFKCQWNKVKSIFSNLKAKIKNLTFKKAVDNYKEFNVFLGKNLNLIFFSVFKSIRTYVYIFIIPLILVTVIFLYQSYGGLNVPLPPIVAGYLLIPGFAVTILLNTLISEWKASIFLKRIHTIGTNRAQFLLSIWLVGYLLGIISIIFCSACITLIAYIMNGSNNVFVQLFSFLSYGSVGEVLYSWLGFIVGASIVIFTSIGLATLISGTFKNIAFCQSLGILVIIVCFVMSDLFLSPQILASSKVATYLSYLIPQKYGVWTVFYAASSGNVNYFIPNPGSERIIISFLRITWPIIGGILWCIGLYLLSIITFKWNNRG